MTLICSVQGLGIGFLGTSDILISSPSAEKDKTVALPLRKDPVHWGNAVASVTGVAQKMVIAGKTVLQWAGSMAVAQVAFKALYRASNAGRDLIELKGALAASGLSDAELNQVSIIYHFADGDLIQRRHHNCDGYEGHGYRILASGSGTWDYLQDTLVSANEETLSAKEAYFSFLSRTVFHGITDAVSDSNHDFFYGGWFEIGADEERAFKKIPYAIKLWSISNGRINPHLPTFFSWYRGHDLFVCSVHIEKSAPSNERRSAIAIHRVDDFLGRRSISNSKSPAPRWCPRIVCHVVLQPGTEDAVILIEKDQPESLRYEANSKTGQTTVIGSKELIRKLTADPSASEIAFAIEKQSWALNPGG